jgi:hypothetical protein
MIMGKWTRRVRIKTLSFSYISLDLANGRLEIKRKRPTKEKMHHKIVEKSQQIQTRKIKNKK